MPRRIPKEWKNVTVNELLFGDFDHDGIRNVDDPKPFGHKTFAQAMRDVRQVSNKESQFIDKNRETLLSKELRKTKAFGDVYAKPVKSFLRNNPDAVGRVKSVPSIIKKLRERQGPTLGDVGGVKVVVRDRCQLERKVKELKNTYPLIKKGEDDYYKNPTKDGIYKAHHLLLSLPEGRKMEIQIKTKRQSEFHDKVAHALYKEYGVGKLPKNVEERLRNKAKELDKKDSQC